MSIDRAKALKAAQKHLAKGQLDRAITEYQKVVADDPSDARSLLKLGDLYTRQGALQDAAATYRQVAEQYAEQGFFLKAVAVYKQILKLDPAELRALEKLGEMYELLSLTSDALSTFEQVVDAHTRSGQPDRAIDALGHIAGLQPDNVAARVRYAEMLSKADRIDEAIESFRLGADELKRQGRMEDYVKVTERLLFHCHDDVDRARELAEIYLNADNPKAALSHLQMCFKEDSRNPETLTLLASAFERLDQGVKAVSVLKELVRIHAEGNALAEEAEALRRLLQLDPNDAQARERLQALGDAGEAVPAEVDDDAIEIVEEDDLDDLIIVDEDDDAELEPAEVQQTAAATEAAGEAQPEAAEDREALVARLMSECDVFVRYNLQDKVLMQLRRVLELDPEHLDAREKLKDALLREGETDAAVAQLVALSERDPLRAQEYLQEAERLAPHNPAVRAALAGGAAPQSSAQQAPPAKAAASEVAFDSFEEDEEDDVIIVDEADDSSFAGVLDDEDEPEMMLEDSDEDLESLGVTEAELAASMAPPPRAAAPDPPPVEPMPELMPEATAAPLPPPEPPPSVASTPEPAPVESVAQPVPTAQEIAEETTEELPEEITEVLEEVDFYLSQELTDEAREALTDAIEEHGEHPALTARLAELDGDTAAPAEPAPVADAEEDQSFAMAQKLADEAGTPPQGGPVDVGDVISQFKEGVKSQVDPNDTATHYDLGIAYMEMGLHGEAIDEFKLCLDDGDKECTAHTMIGLSYVAKGEMPPAIEHFKNALSSPAMKPEEELDLWFEIGNAYELLGKASEALVWYEKVEEHNPEFRDVAARIERLGVAKSEEEEVDEFDEMFDNMILKD